MTNSKEERKRRDLTAAENYHLWVACGGMCSFNGCKKRLIESRSGDLTNVGIKAHIIGHAKNSARHEYMGKYGFTYETLEDVKNLMLMCYDHSKIIDDKKTRDKFPPDLLFAMKEEHENWVSSWSVDKKKSIALIHKRMGGGPIAEIDYDGEAPFILIDAVEDQTVFDNFTKEGWEDGKVRNQELYQKFLEKIKEKEANAGEIFPISPIPLLIHLGSLLTDTVPYSIYQYNREKGLWVSNNPGVNEEIVLNVKKGIKEFDDLAVLVSISGKVKMSSVEEVLGDDFDFLSIEVDDPDVKRVLYREDVVNIQAKLKYEIEKLMQQQDYNKIHLFYAGPAGLAIEIGRGINPKMWSEVCLYEYNKRCTPKYQYALSI